MPNQSPDRVVIVSKILEYYLKTFCTWETSGSLFFMFCQKSNVQFCDEMKYIVCIIQSRCKLNSLNWYYKSLYFKIILFDISENGRSNLNSRESFLFSLHTYWQGSLDRPVHHELSLRTFFLNTHGVLWSNVVYCGPFWSIMGYNLWSIMVQFGPLWSIVLHWNIIYLKNNSFEVLRSFQNYRYK